MELNEKFWRGRRVFVTGHTGFKGGWLTLLLKHLGASVHGYALAPITDPNIFSIARIAGGLAEDIRADIRNPAALEAAMRAAAPEVVIHLAAQPLVVRAYAAPVETYETNVMGTLYLLEAIRRLPSVRAALVVTTDKCYENLELATPFQETDPLGGYDPYSSSKACAEILTNSYRRSYFSGDELADSPGIATARAGNVVGGGDWSADRLIPDCIRAFSSGRAAVLRYPSAIRPWQHVIEPLVGYLMLLERLSADDRCSYVGAWNFGPDMKDEAAVGSVAERIAALWGESAKVETIPAVLHEATTLRLDIGKAKKQLGWYPRWTLERTLAATVDWYRACHQNRDMEDFSLRQIDEYLSGVSS